jgi:hypothetical protein
LTLRSVPDQGTKDQMPWFVTLILFVLSPIYAIVVRDKLWPRVQDWWASRSARGLQERIAKLQQQLHDAETQPLLGEVQEEILLGLQRVYLLIGFSLYMLIGCFLIPVSVFSRSLEKLVGTAWTLGLSYFYLAIAFITLFVTWLYWRGSKRYLRPRTLDGRMSLQKEIEELTAKLKKMSFSGK